MASFMPAACSPRAMDHAMERLLATPKTTPLRPCKSADMLAPCSSEREKDNSRRRWLTTEDRGRVWLNLLVSATVQLSFALPTRSRAFDRRARRETRAEFAE